MKNKKILILIFILSFSTNLIYCQQNNSSPKNNFEVFWNFFDTYYAFFTQKNVDWKEKYSKYSPLVSDSTTDDELFDIFVKMITPLQDGHVSIKTIDGKKISISRKSRFKEEFNSKELRDSLWSIIDLTLTKNGFNELSEFGPTDNSTGSMFYFSKSKHIGYLRIGKFFNEIENLQNDDRFVKGYHELQDNLDTLIDYYSPCKGLVVDVRCTPGGYDKYAYAIASRFVAKEKVGHYECKRNGGGYDEYTDWKPNYLKPDSNHSFLHPIILLTNDQTASASDVFSLLMKSIDSVTIIGENSEGIFSDIEYKELPNGWTVTLSDECYFSADTISYEGGGVPVDIEILNTKQDLKTKEDPLIMKSLEVLSK